jgi:aminopeptidase N
MLKRREDYTPPTFLVTAVDLNIDIHDLGSIVTTKLAVTPNPTAGGAGILHLDGRGLELQSISVDGNPLADADYSHDESGLQITGLTGACVVETIAKCHPETNTALEGLYLSGGMYCTQCEPEGFRRIGFYPDRPDVMSIFTVRLEAARTYPQSKRAIVVLTGILPSGMTRIQNQAIYLRRSLVILIAPLTAFKPCRGARLIFISMLKRAMWV